MLSAALNIDIMRLDLVSSGKRSIARRGVCVTLLFNMCLCMLERQSKEVREWHSDLRCRVTQTKLLSHNSNITYVHPTRYMNRSARILKPPVQYFISPSQDMDRALCPVVPGTGTSAVDSPSASLTALNGKCNSMFKIKPVTFFCCV